jgi:pyruvate,water dikinase
MGIPCVVGTQEATKLLQENQEVTVDGFNGKVYKGAILKADSPVKKEVMSVTKKTKIK